MLSHHAFLTLRSYKPESLQFQTLLMSNPLCVYASYHGCQAAGYECTHICAYGAAR